jgi:MoaA/NifB/PqqE/SkfB family radical SAM enzyme
MRRIIYAHVAEDGRLILPAEVSKRFGLEPGSRAVLVEGTNQITLHLPVTALRRVYIEPTNACNLNCLTCMRNVWDEPQGRMGTETFERILDSLRSFSPLPMVFFGGLGEPLFHPHIIEMIASVKAIGARVEMITNGTLLSDTLAEEIIDSGLDFLWVSIDGATAESYMDIRLGDVLPQVIENLKRLCSRRDAAYGYTPQIGIAFVAMRRNIADLPSVMRLGAELGVKRYSITNVLAHTPLLAKETLYDNSLNHTDASTADVSPHINLPRIDLTPETLPALEKLLEHSYQISLGENEIGLPTDKCPFVARGSLSIRWDGEVSPCLPLLHTHESYLDERVRSSKAHSLGNVAEHDLLGIWNTPDYLALRETLQSFAFSPCAFCNSCEMANDNIEDCYGNIKPTCGGCLWAQGFIQCP